MSDLKISIAKTLVHEGGFQNDKNDHANWTSGKIGEGELKGTKYGITAFDMPDADIENLTPEQATQWYLTTTQPQRFCNPLYDYIENQSVCDKLFDMGVLFGVGEAVAIIQVTLNIKVDCGFGPQTLSSVNAAEPVSLLASYKTNLMTHAFNVATANPLERENLPGWGKRVNS